MTQLPCLFYLIRLSVLFFFLPMSLLISTVNTTRKRISNFKYCSNITSMSNLTKVLALITRVLLPLTSARASAAEATGRERWCASSSSEGPSEPH